MWFAGLPFSISLVDDECLYHIMSHDNDDGTYRYKKMMTRCTIRLTSNGC